MPSNAHFSVRLTCSVFGALCFLALAPRTAAARDEAQATALVLQQTTTHAIDTLEGELTHVRRARGALVTSHQTLDQAIGDPATAQSPVLREILNQTSGENATETTHAQQVQRLDAAIAQLQSSLHDISTLQHQAQTEGANAALSSASNLQIRSDALIAITGSAARARISFGSGLTQSNAALSTSFLNFADPYVSNDASDAPNYSVLNHAVGFIAGRNTNNQIAPLCTATLVAANAAITAAHCFCPTQEAELSECESYTNGGNGAPSRLRDMVFFVPGSGAYALSAVHMHPEYVFAAEGSANDVAIVILNNLVSDVAPMPIAFTQAAAPVGGAYDVMGFGRANDAAGASATSIFVSGLKVAGRFTSSDCATEVRGIANANASYVCWEQGLTKGQSTIGTCPGDSGGPLMTTAGVFSVISYGVGSDCMTGGRVNTRLAAVQNFVQTTLGPQASPPVPMLSAATLFEDEFIAPAPGQTWEPPLPIRVPVGAKRLVVSVNGDISHMFALSVSSSTSDALCNITKQRSFGVCTIDKPTPGDWRIAVGTSSPFVPPPRFQIVISADS